MLCLFGGQREEGQGEHHSVVTDGENWRLQKNKKQKKMKTQTKLGQEYLLGFCPHVLVRLLWGGFDPSGRKSRDGSRAGFGASGPGSWTGSRGRRRAMSTMKWQPEVEAVQREAAGLPGFAKALPSQMFSVNGKCQFLCGTCVRTHVFFSHLQLCFRQFIVKFQLTSAPLAPSVNKQHAGRAAYFCFLRLCFVYVLLLFFFF